MEGRDQDLASSGLPLKCPQTWLSHVKTRSPEVNPGLRSGRLEPRYLSQHLITPSVHITRKKQQQKKVAAVAGAEPIGSK